MFNFFKSKEQKEKELQTKCDFLNEKYKDIFNIMCIRHNILFTIKEFEIRDNEINLILYEGEEGIIKLIHFNFFKLHYNLDEYYSQSRLDFIRIKKQLNDFGYSIDKMENKS